MKLGESILRDTLWLSSATNNSDKLLLTDLCFRVIKQEEYEVHNGPHNFLQFACESGKI